MAKITYGDELPDDSVGKKFQGAVYDTGAANAIAAVKGVNPVTQQGKTVVDQSVAVSTASGAGAAGGLAADAAVTTDATGTRSAYLRGIVTWFARLGALDGAAFTAGSSYVWPGLAGVYQSTVSLLTAGKTGLARLTERRAVVVAGDNSSGSATSSSVASMPADIQVSVSDYDGGMTTPTVAFFDGSDVGFGASARYIKIPMGSAGWRTASLTLYNALDVAVTIDLYARLQSSAFSVDFGLLDSVAAVSPSQKVEFYPFALGAASGGYARAVPTIQSPMAELILKITPASDPTSGSIQFMVSRRS